MNSSVKKQYNYHNEPYNIDYLIEIPYNESIQELAHVLIEKNGLLVYIEQELTQHLETFIKDKTSKYYEELSNNIINKGKNNQSLLDEVVKDWKTVMKSEMMEYGEKRCASDEELFATAYHKLVHSSALEIMLQLEYMYSKTVRQKSKKKSDRIKDLSEKQSKEMNDAVDKLGDGMTESEINELVGKHYEAHSLLQGRLTSELDTIKEAQRREYREWIMQMLEQNETTSSIPKSTSPLASTSTRVFGNADYNREIQNVPILEESFTIHLGSQLKQMHNIRVLSINVSDLYASHDSEEMSEPTPQLLQTALGLYSNDLSGLVLMTDNKIGSRLSQEFQDICQRTTEFHFHHVEDQLNEISYACRQYLKSNECTRNSNSELLKAGDFYMTKHSNLSEVHVIFHMVTDDTLKGNDINSRHPVILGIRHILKTACSNDVTSLTIPLLLQYEMTEDMTVQWCEKRAELVFKCVKGFMIEMASWGGAELKNLQFILPEGISPSVFSSMTEMLPRIFKLCNPKVF